MRQIGLNDGESRDEIGEPRARDRGDDLEAVVIHAEAGYTAYVRDLYYMWHWEIHRNGEFLQEGCSLSEGSSREAVAHVLSFFKRQNLSKAAPGDKTEEIQKLLREIGVPEALTPQN